jgi:hypothetical protein
MSPARIPEWDVRKQRPPAPVRTELDDQIENTLNSPDPLTPCAELDDPISDVEVTRAVKGLGASTAPGPDEIPPLFLKKGSPSVRRCLTLIFNASWRWGVLPKQWKLAYAFSIFKKGARPDPSAYRIICITSILIRTFERIVKVRLTAYLERRSFFAPTQAGFRHALSTVDHLYLLQRAVRNALRKRRQLPVVFLDIVKAFDRVPHDRLLYKLHKQAGISGKAWIWLRSFLANRQFCITQGAHKSAFVSASAGVPQGAVLSPLLFIIYINDLAVNCPFRIHQSYFADDVAAWPQLRNYNLEHQLAELRRFLHYVSNWSKIWRLHFSHDKSALLLIHHRTPDNAPDPPDEPLILCNNELAVEDSYKYLGHLLHRSSAFKDHHSAVIQKSRLTAYYIGRVTSRNSLPSPTTICRIVKAVLIPQITYGFAFLDLSSSFIHKLTQIIATPLRKALGLGRFAAAHRVLWEYGLYDVVTLHLKLGVAALMRSQRCLSRGIELAGNLAFDFAGPQPDDTTKFCRPRAGIIKEMLTSLDLASAPTNLTDLKTALDKKARENYMSLVSPPTLALKPQLPPLPSLN